MLFSNIFKRNKKSEENGISVLLAGNPNVGKSTVFNSLTGLHRHTGNWAGKTVDSAVSSVYGKRKYSFFDIPGTYSLLSHSREEELARDYICFGGAKISVVVCDATMLMRGLALVLQISEVMDNMVLCLNMSDEAERCGIAIDEKKLSFVLGFPVLKTVARTKSSAKDIISALDSIDLDKSNNKIRLHYKEEIEKEVEGILNALRQCKLSLPSERWVALRLLEGDVGVSERVCENLSHQKIALVESSVLSARERLLSFGMDEEKIRDHIVGTVMKKAEKISALVSQGLGKEKRERDQKIDSILTGKVLAVPFMLTLVGILFLITMLLANYPSMLLSSAFSRFEAFLWQITSPLPPFISGALVGGVYKTLSSVVAVMLPPMAIFFPLFTILEDSGYLPRIAYNLDRPFARAGACGKQALTMCMGIGCNAVGCAGARIIDSERERILAILTNSLMPCNGRLPMLLSLIGVIFIFINGSANSFLVALTLLFFVALSVFMTFVTTSLLSKTLLKGKPSLFTIELPPYRRPEILKVVLNSLKGKVLSVLLRAVVVAAPMGLVIYLLSEIYIGGVSVVEHLSMFLDPIARIFGLDGVIILAFVLGIPANEIVIPIMLAIYLKNSSPESIGEIFSVFFENGWTVKTAVCTSLFALFHWPCSTTLITAYKETKSIKYTLLSFLIPTSLGLTVCLFANIVLSLFSL